MNCKNERLLNNIKKKKISEKFNQVYSICLICGRQGHHDVFINSATYLSCSGTQLTKFLIKIIGEEPCYSLSRLMCHQCFLLLDRLDTYQSRAAEISSYISSRYKETKFELLGNRQTISELIVSTLSNIRNFKSGTTLNVCDELSVTVFRENLQRKEPKSSIGNSLKTGAASNNNSSNNNNNNNNNNSNNNKNNNCENYKKFKRKRTSLFMPKDSVKKQKITLANNNNNNNNLIENKSVVCDNVGPESPVVNTVHNGSEHSESEGESDQNEKRQGDGNDSSSGNTASKENVVTNNSKSSSGSNSSVSSSSSSSSTSSDTSGSDSSSSSSDNSSDEEDNKVAIKINGSEEKSKQQELKEKSPIQCKIKEEKSIESEVKVKEEIESETILERKHKIKTNQESENLNEKEEMGAIESHLAEAVLAQSSLASNLLQSFLSTSLWMSSSSSDSASHPNFSSLPMQQQKQIVMMQNETSCEDMTVESLNSAAAVSINDKEKRLELKNTGQSYVNTKGKLMEAKRVWPQDCSRCPLRCNDRLSEATRQKIFSDYWGLGNYEHQREYLALHMEREERIGKSGLTRTVVLYFLTCNRKKYQVCRQFFLKTLDVSEKASRIVLEKKLKGELGVEVPKLPLADNESNSELSC